MLGDYMMLSGLQTIILLMTSAAKPTASDLASPPPGCSPARAKTGGGALGFATQIVARLAEGASIAR